MKAFLRRGRQIGILKATVEIALQKSEFGGRISQLTEKAKASKQFPFSEARGFSSRTIVFASSVWKRLSLRPESFFFFYLILVPDSFAIPGRLLDFYLARDSGPAFSPVVRLQPACAFDLNQER